MNGSRDVIFPDRYRIGQSKLVQCYVKPLVIQSAFKIMQGINANLLTISRLTAKEIEDLAHGNSLNDYCRANLTALWTLLARNTKALDPYASDVTRHIFLGDADINMKDSIAFSPPLNKGNIAIVDPIMINNNFYVDKLLDIANNAPPFQEREDICYWRGALTGTTRYDISDIWRDREKYLSAIVGKETELQRVRLCRLSSQYESLFDCKITSSKQWLYSEMIWSILADEQLTSSEHPFCENFTKKYLIDIDGNSNSWPGFFMKLGSGSCVIKVDSPFSFYQWYYRYLTPWKHYVPVRNDLEDLASTVEYLRSKPDISEEISNNARRFVMNKTADQWEKLAIEDIRLNLRMIS